MANNWTNDGGYLSNGKLNKKWRRQLQPMIKFRQFCRVKEAFGKRSGDTLNYDVISNVATQGGTLVETSTMPETSVTITQGTMSVTEWGNSIPYTGKLRDLTELPLENEYTKALRNDAAKAINVAVEGQMDLCKHRYVGTATGGGVMTSNGTATATASSQLLSYHLKEMVDQLMVLNAEPLDGEYFTMLGTIKACRGLHDSLESIKQYTEYPYKGEVGKWYQCRVVRDSHAMDNDIGASDVTGEAYVFGGDALGGPVIEAVAVPEEIRVKLPDDYGRGLGKAWYMIANWDLIHDGTNSPDYNVIKWDSA